MALQQRPAGASNSLASPELACTGVSSVQGPPLDLRNFAKFSGMFLEANVTISLTQQLKPKKCFKSPNLAPWNQQASLYEGHTKNTHEGGLPPHFPSPHHYVENTLPQRLPNL